MKNILNKIKTIAALAVAGVATTGCSLDMLPLNQVVLESFWTNETDVKSVVNSCYVGMQQNGYMEKLLVWSEVRSDNVSVGPDAETNTDLKYLMKGNILSTNNYLNWGALYTVINRCNTVLKYAPEVHAKDPNYTDYDLNVTQAEVKFIRAFSYLTLAKTFRNVPFSFEPSVDDTQDYLIPATSFEQILNSLIDDIESCKDFPPYANVAADGLFSLEQSTGRVTRPAMYTLLAELYLWRAAFTKSKGDYEACVRCCDVVLDFKLKQYNERSIDELRSSMNALIDQDVYSTFGYPLLASRYEGANEKVNENSAAYLTFIKGNSFESIFEVTYGGNESDLKNTDLTFMYGGFSSDKKVKKSVYGSQFVMNEVPKSNVSYLPTSNKLFQTMTDARSILDFQYSQNFNHQITKYVVKSPRWGTLYETWKEASVAATASEYKEQTQNWIVYRMTEVMLMRAEAEIQLAGMMSGEDLVYDDAIPFKTERKRGTDILGASAQELYNDAFNLITAVYARSNVRTIQSQYKTKNYAFPKRTDFVKKSQFDSFLLDERRREFLFESKRYYDLVRDALRSNKQSRIVEAIKRNYNSSNVKAAKRLETEWGMFLPIHKQQLKINPNLTQNPQYADEEEDNKKN